MNNDLSNKGSKPANGILSVTIADTSVLHASYMPFVNNGGLFIPTNKSYEIGDEVFILLTLLHESEQIPLAGKVVWITPLQPQDKRAPGIGVQFNDDESELVGRIENYLTGLLNSEKTTHTM